MILRQILGTGWGCRQYRCPAWQPMTIDVAFQALISLFPGATVALGRAPS